MTKNARPTRLLILSCSKRKRTSEEPLPALQRYDGPAFRTLRKWLPTADSIELIILSAKYGFIRGNQPILNYDNVMPLHVQQVEQNRYRDQIATLLEGCDFESIFVNLGGRYSHLLPPLQELGMSTEDIVWASGRIGKRLKQLKFWLDKTSSADRGTL